MVRHRTEQSEVQYPVLMYTLEAEVNSTGETLTDVNPYYVTVRYGPSPAMESTLGLYRWVSGSWVMVPGSSVDTAAGTVSASPDRMGAFAVLGETQRLFLPLVIRS
jgi:hypothetical protein